MANHSTSGLPFISCMMPTYGRPDYVNEAVKMFLDQDYPADRRELIVMNDCVGQRLQSELPPASGVRVINQNQRFATLGEKRNAIIEMARGELIAVWDDDDLYLPWRLSFSVDQMRALNTRFYRASTFWAYWGAPDLLTNEATRQWIGHSLCLFDIDLWRCAGGYPKMDTGEDTQFCVEVQLILGRRSEDWISYPVCADDRYYVMRGLSKYTHMSIEGGTGDPDTDPGVRIVRPMEIQDATLREAFQYLIRNRGQITS